MKLLLVFCIFFVVTVAFAKTTESDIDDDEKDDSDHDKSDKNASPTHKASKYSSPYEYRSLTF